MHRLQKLQLQLAVKGNFAAATFDVLMLVLCSAQVAFVNDPLDVAVVLATNTVTSFVAPGFYHHRYNQKSPLVHTQDAIHNGLANIELGHVHQTHPFMETGATGKKV